MGGRRRVNLSLYFGRGGFCLGGNCVSLAFRQGWDGVVFFARAPLLEPDSCSSIAWTWHDGYILGDRGLEQPARSDQPRL